MKAVILAGGKGARLAPYTRILPKPLMPIDDMPILEVLLRQLKNSGVKDIVIALRPGSPSAKKAEGAQFKVLDPSAAAKWADVSMIVTPDEGQGALYRDHMHPNLRQGTATSALSRATQWRNINRPRLLSQMSSTHKASPSSNRTAASGRIQCRLCAT